MFAELCSQPLPPPPGQAQREPGAHRPSSRHLLNNQELVGCVSPLSLVAMEAVGDNPSLPTIKPFLAESGSGTLSFSSGRGRGQRPLGP